MFDALSSRSLLPQQQYELAGRMKGQSALGVSSSPTLSPSLQIFIWVMST